MILKNRDIADCHTLYQLMTDPAVYPFVRQKPTSYDEFVFLTKQTIELEERQQLISRTIVDEWGAPIGTINLYDIHNQSGFLGTWIGKPYFGKGYNKIAKDAFFDELFFQKEIQTIYMRIRKENTRSFNAAMKLPYCMLANQLNKELYEQINQIAPFDLFQIDKDQYNLYMKRAQLSEFTNIEMKEA